MYTLMPTTGPSTVLRSLSSVLQDFALEVKAYQTQREHVAEVALEVQRHLASSAMDVGTVGAVTDRSAGTLRPVSTLQVPGAASSNKKQRTRRYDGAGGADLQSGDETDEIDPDSDAGEHDECAKRRT